MSNSEDFGMLRRVTGLATGSAPGRLLGGDEIRPDRHFGHDGLAPLALERRTGDVPGDDDAVGIG